MNILLVCYEYPPIGGGGGVGAKQYAEAWARKGHRVAVLTSRDKGLPRHERLNQVDIIRVFILGKNARATATFFSMLTYIIAGFFYVLFHPRYFRQFHVINTHFSIPSGPLGVLASKLLHIPHVLTIIGGDIYDPSKKMSPHRHWLTRKINRFIINSADRVVAISSDTKTRALQYYDLDRDVHVINYGFDHEGLNYIDEIESIKSNKKYVLISVGRLVKRKGFEYLIQAMQKLPDDVVLYIVGDGPLENDLKRLTRTYHLNDRVHFLGYKNRDEIFTYLKQSDCFVLSSLHEGLCIAIQEAMYAGLPIVATDNGGQVDLIQDGCNGLLVPPADPDMLAAAIYKFYADPQLADSVRLRNAQSIQNFYLDANADLYMHLFDELIAPSNP